MDLTPPVSRNGFEYYNHEFYAVVSQHRHRRWSIPKLRAFFSSTSQKTSVKEKPAHWYRAQLLHYGLQPTDVKGTAMMRLLDSLNRDELDVPPSLKKLEKDLKKQWEGAEKRGTKRKATSSKGTGTVKSDKGKQKGTPTSGVLNFLASAQQTISVGSLNINYYGGGGPVESNQDDERSAKKPRKKKDVAPSPATPKPPTASPQRPVQSHVKTETSPSTRLTLGLINGSYKIDSAALNTRNSGMILCLDRTSIWGEFQFGYMEGILFMAERPWQVSYSGTGGCSFEWRAVDQQTRYGYVGHGEMRFLGDGSVEGTFFRVPDDPYGVRSDCDFWGHRTSGKNKTRAPWDAWSMKAEFDQIRL